MAKYLRSNWRRIVIMSIVLANTGIGLCQRALWRHKMYLWQDESTQISWMNGTLWQTVLQTKFNLQFPGDYILIYPFYKLFGANKWALAIPHIIITLVGFYLFYVLCKKYFKTIWGFLVAFVLFAQNYNLHNHSFEIRAYSVNITLGIAGFLVMQYIFEKKNPSLIKTILISVFIFIATFFHITVGYILFFCYLFHLLLSRKEESISRALLRHVRYYGSALVVTLIMVYLYISSSSGIDSVNTTYPFTFEYIPKGVLSVLKGIFGNLTGPREFYPLLSGIIIVFLIPHKEWLKQLMFFILLIILPIGGVLLAAIHFNYWFIQRLFIWAIPLFIFFLGWVWDSIIVYFEKRLKTILSLS